ncbi:MAG: cation diffusion facilitator family transporter [Holophaga sp.]|nr:cation diffusion facilitator family transporter [Holophaga sp.]
MAQQGDLSNGRDCRHSHQHPEPRAGGLGTPARLAWSSVVFGVGALIQGIGGFWTGSLGLVSDSLENLNDLVANLLNLTSLLVACRREPSERFAYGWHRLEVFNTLLGAGMLLALAVGIVREAIHRLRAPQAIQTGWVVGFCCLGLALNFTAAMVLRPREEAELERDANLKSAYLHAFSDSVASLALLAGMLVIRFTGWRWIDPLVAVVIVAFIMRGAYGLAADAIAILMHRAAFDHAEARRQLMLLPGVLGVEDIRSWRLCSHLVVCTAHVQVAVERLEDTQPVELAIERVLTEKFRVRHLTVHFETRLMAGEHSHRFVHEHEADDHHGHSHAG